MQHVYLLLFFEQKWLTSAQACVAYALACTTQLFGSLIDRSKHA